MSSPVRFVLAFILGFFFELSCGFFLQEPLASEVFQKILDSDSTYPDIKTSLKNLDIAISFLKSVGGDINMSLESYLSQTLQIQNPLPVLKVDKNYINLSLPTKYFRYYSLLNTLIVKVKIIDFLYML